jgi:hypothetical protein
MRDLIAAREKDFARGFTEHLIEYAPFQECFKDRDSPFKVFAGGGLSGEPWFASSLRRFHHPERDSGRLPWVWILSKRDAKPSKTGPEFEVP